jgi:hypothetical protein
MSFVANTVLGNQKLFYLWAATRNAAIKALSKFPDKQVDCPAIQRSSSLTETAKQIFL